MSDAFEFLIHIAAAVKPKRAFTEFAVLEDLGFPIILKHDDFADSQLAAGANERSPCETVRRFGLQEEDFYSSGKSVTMAEQAGRNDAGIIQDEAVPRPQESRKLREAAIFPALLVPIKDEHARVLPTIEGTLRDQFFGQGVIEFG